MTDLTLYCPLVDSPKILRSMRLAEIRTARRLIHEATPPMVCQLGTCAIAAGVMVLKERARYAVVKEN